MLFFLQGDITIMNSFIFHSHVLHVLSCKTKQDAIKRSLLRKIEFHVEMGNFLFIYFIIG